MNTQLDTTESLNNESIISLSHGVSFYFTDEGQQITVSRSLHSGKDNVFLDQKKVSSKYSCGFNSCQQFKLNDVDYEVELKVENFITRRISCTLIKNGAHLKTRYFSWADDKKQSLKIMSVYFITGMATGFFAGYFHGYFVAG